MAYPVAMRHRALALMAAGMTGADVGRALGVTGSWATSIRRLDESGAALEPKSSANHRSSLAEREGPRLRARVAEHPGTTLADLKRDLGLPVSIPAIWHALRDLKITLKKRR